jgi:G:T-mismatch repair DNA endonuclease (very short patch repair protein)
MAKFLKTLFVLGCAAAFIGGCAQYKFKTYDVKCPKCNTTFTIEEEQHLKSLGFGSP